MPKKEEAKRVMKFMVVNTSEEPILVKGGIAPFYLLPGQTVDFVDDVTEDKVPSYTGTVIARFVNPGYDRKDALGDHFRDLYRNLQKAKKEV